MCHQKRNKEEYCFGRRRVNQMMCYITNRPGMFGAEGGNRTLTSREAPGILSPVRLPIPPPRRIANKNGGQDRI
jgi:hypothetical protein